MKLCLLQDYLRKGDHAWGLKSRLMHWKKSVMRSVLFQATSVKTKFQPYAAVHWILVSLNPDNYKFPLPNLWNRITEEYNDPLYSKSWNKREGSFSLVSWGNGFAVTVLCERVFSCLALSPFLPAPVFDRRLMSQKCLLSIETLDNYIGNLEGYM